MKTCQVLINVFNVCVRPSKQTWDKRSGKERQINKKFACFLQWTFWISCLTCVGSSLTPDRQTVLRSTSGRAFHIKESLLFCVYYEHTDILNRAKSIKQELSKHAVQIYCNSCTSTIITNNSSGTQFPFWGWTWKLKKKKWGGRFKV